MPEASNWIRGSFDSGPRLRSPTAPTANSPPPRAEPGVTTVTATLIRQEKIARTDASAAGAVAIDRAVPALLVENVTKRFVVGRKRKPVTAIANVSLRLERGDIVGILGANGSGKSTLIRLVSGLLTLDEGRAEVFGHDIERDEMAVKRLINRVSVDAAFVKAHSPIEELRETHDASIVLTTHDLAEAERLCGSITVLAGGRVVVENSPAGLIAAEADRIGRPATLHDVFMTHTGRSLDDDVEDEDSADDDSE